MTASNTPSTTTTNAHRPYRKTGRRMPVRECPIGEPVEIAKFWKSARDRRNSIGLSIKQYEGHIFLDCRVFGTNADGQMVPTMKGITVGMARLPEFLRGVQRAHAKAVELGLIDGASE